jgi:hypothetical protein
MYLHYMDYKQNQSKRINLRPGFSWWPAPPALKNRSLLYPFGLVIFIVHIVQILIYELSYQENQRMSRFRDK